MLHKWNREVGKRHRSNAAGSEGWEGVGRKVVGRGKEEMAWPDASCIATSYQKSLTDWRRDLFKMSLDGERLS